MEEKLQIRAPLGSKLPKFGGPKSSGSFIQRAPNDTHSNLLTKSSLVGEKHSDHDRASGFSLNWRKLQQNGQISRELPNTATEKGFSPYQIALGKDFQKPRKQSNMLLLSQKEDLNENLLSNSNKFSKVTPLGRAAYHGLNGCKTLVNGFYTNKPPTGLHRPRANSASSRNFPSKALSTENKPFSSVRRSQSFSHSVQNSLLPNAPLTRSHSFNREVDPARPYQSQYTPMQTAFRHSALSRTVKQFGLSNGNDPQMKSNFTRTYPGGSSLGLKKPGLSNSPSVTVPLGYRMSRPSLQKNKLYFNRENICNDSKGPSAAPLIDKIEPLSTGTCQATVILDKDVEEELDVDNCSSFENLDKQNCKDSYYSEDVDELSISSLSSSDKNDLSEDFSDDFIDLEDGNKTVIDVDSENKVTEKPTEQLLAELRDKNQIVTNHSDEWIDVNITVEKEAEVGSRPYGETRISPDMDYRDPSSLELSPSDSSDGTYMWDEEGMEPIGNVHPCGSYDSSEMNSLDILNNLESCDLEDDDLMLDVDLPEDTTCDMGKIESMSRAERSLRQKQVFWKRAPPRLNGQEQYHLSNPDHYENGRGSSYLDSPTDHRESYGSPSFYSQSPRSTQMMGLRDNTVILDEMTLCHMVQDCTNVKTQLLKLKRMLQQADDPEFPLQEVQQSVPTTPEPQDTDTLLKTEDLLREIQQLKEESKKKDETIKQLQQQLKTTCKCQKESQESKVVKPKQQDKYTQTTWRRSSPQILQRSISSPNSTDHTSGKLIAHPHAELQNIPKDNTHHFVPYCQQGDSGTITEVPEKELSDLLSKRLKIDDVDDNPEQCKKEVDSNNQEQLDDKNLRPQEQLDNNKNIRPQEVLDGPTPFPVNIKKDVKSKANVNSAAPVPGEILKSRTLHLPKPKMHSALSQKGVTHSNYQVSSNPSSKETQMLNMVSSRSLSQSSNDSQNMVQKSQPTVHNDPSLHQPPDSSCPVHSQSRITMLGTKQLNLNPSPSVNNSKLSSEVALPSEIQVPTSETSKPVSRLMPKGSLLRPPSNLKKPNSSKADASSEHQKSPVKFSPTVITRPLSNKRDSLQENVESLVPKRQSRLPQPKAH
ncbi:serine-rich coiled-coil domain-containing protein 2 isoform X1 [Bufo gargarizans]|uniref:serine-rich coiled-coil domain-containing protein 2 isoform X1 n=1 Tax=Bufo gargarizans TaxID=30331 RepID=UPI001CF2596D|nr:serine-rich coiled-coil domain-containing protein 2 isoform X1 [Bufo gargarizans]XP_044158497.1 serine-rich coiled-coil domain-containing protein 2 isoform X1 [Bufo gargarizans]